MRFNPYGPGAKTVEGGRHIRELLAGRDLKKVCGVDYVMDFNDWLRKFDALLVANR
ncbi:MAG: hypothetical protein OIN66_12130 [Candidatus Methanoperedens sp.]|nr:hypothetical protein [Candidatus Methanoperedens sp.]